MSWIWRFLLWSTVLTGCCWFITRAYQAWLADTAVHALALLGHRARIGGLQAPFTFALGIFAAMCLATTKAPVRERTRALVLGLGAVVGYQLLFVIVMTLAVGFIRQRGLEANLNLVRLTAYTVEVVPWLCAPLAWIVFLGRWSVPRAGERDAESKGSRGETRRMRSTGNSVVGRPDS